MDSNFTGYSFNVNENSCRCTCLNLQELRSPAKEAHFAINISIMTVNIFILIPGIILNTLVLSAYVKNSHFQTSANMLLMVLSLSDLCVCIFAQTIWIMKRILELFVTFNCYIWVANRLVSHGTVGVSLLIITLLSVERFVTLSYPFRYQIMITRARLRVLSTGLSILVWILVLSHMFQLPHNFAPIMTGSFIIICVTLITVIWLWIHRLISKHKRQIVTSQLPVTTKTRLKTVIRNTKTSYLVCGSVLLCFTPSLAVNIYYISGFKSDVIYFYVIPWFYTFAFASSLFNPVILLYRKKDFREAVRHLIRL